jgi:N-acetylglucosaminyldiphosphoundecaprenol N-acetyl-beta-D-mannosaminyltransferase
MIVLKRDPTNAQRDSAGTCTVLGVQYRVADLVTATDAVIARALSGQGGYCSLAGVHGVVTAQRREELKRALDHAWANLPDGEPVAWMMRRLGARHTRRVAGPDLMPSVIAAGQAREVRHFFFGSTPSVLSQLEARIRKTFPEAQVVGVMSPPFRPLSEEEEAHITREIVASGAHIVWVGLGLPKQDEWMHRNAAALRPCLAIGVGAAFDFQAGTKPRAPAWMRRHGLEWFHRLISEPRRLGWRYASTNSEFIARIGPALLQHWWGRVCGAIRRSLRIPR